MRIRAVLIFTTLLAATLFLAVAPAEAASVAPGSRAAAARQLPSAGRDLDGVVLDNVLNSVSCTTQPDSPSITSACTAVGYFADGGYVNGLVESSANGQWGGQIFGSIGTVTDPLAVSCVPQAEDIPVCVAVGETFTNAKYPRLLVATGGANGFSPVVYRNPKGSTWSELTEVSCVTATFCMLVGEAGTTKHTAHGLRYLAHATAFRWNGTSLHQLHVAAPAGARSPGFASVSCPTATSCMAVGDYTASGGRVLPYSALWTGGSWRVQQGQRVGGRKSTIFEGVSCAAAGTCVAVGEAAKPGAETFAEQYLAGKWQVMPSAARSRAALYSVSCPAASYCVGAGNRGGRSLIEAWNGTSWATQAVPATAAPLTVDVLQHVSCVSATICTAVGFRHNPHSRYSYHTLAVGWNGTKWVVQKTVND